PAPASTPFPSTRPSQTSYSLVATDSTPATPSFSYTASEGDGNYSFYTRAQDKAGNYEAAPATPPDTSTLVDTATPTSSATSPQYSTSDAHTSAHQSHGHL